MAGSSSSRSRARKRRKVAKLPSDAVIIDLTSSDEDVPQSNNIKTTRPFTSSRLEATLAQHEIPSQRIVRGVESSTIINLKRKSPVKYPLLTVSPSKLGHRTHPDAVSQRRTVKQPLITEFFNTINKNTNSSRQSRTSILIRFPAEIQLRIMKLLSPTHQRLLGATCRVYYNIFKHDCGPSLFLVTIEDLRLALHPDTDPRFRAIIAGWVTPPWWIIDFRSYPPKDQLKYKLNYLETMRIPKPPQLCTVSFDQQLVNELNRAAKYYIPSYAPDGRRALTVCEKWGALAWVEKTWALAGEIQWTGLKLDHVYKKMTINEGGHADLV